MRGYLPRLFLLAALWGSSYFFIKIGVDDVAPTVLMAGRTLLAGTILLGFVLATRGASRVRAELRAYWRQAMVYGIFNAALPFWLIAWGEQHIDSSVAGIAQATVPLFAFVLGIWLLPHEPVARIRWIGVVAWAARRGGAVRSRHVRWVVGRGRNVCDRALVAVVRICRHLRAASCPCAPPGLCSQPGRCSPAGSSCSRSRIAQRPDALPGWETFASVAALAIFGTAIAQLLFFRMLPPYGARRISLVAYLMPGFAIAYGALFLSEPITKPMLLGLGLILVGVALGSGLLLSVRRRAAAEREPA